MPPIQPISLFDIIRPATIGVIIAGLVVVIVLAVLAFNANAAAAASGGANKAVILMIASIMVGVIGIPLAVAVTYALLPERGEETVEVMEMETQPQA